MSAIDLGVYGAKRQSWSGSGPRAALYRLRSKYPKDDVEDLAARMIDDVSPDDQLAIFVYWVTRNLISLEPPDVSIQQFKKSRGVAIGAEVSARIAAVASRLTLSFVMPNGEPLANCSGAYCTKIGGVFSKIGKAVGRKRVGEALSDKQLSDLQRAVGDRDHDAAGAP